ncbi:MAG: hypothetical protein QOF01_1983 [Thermomicrobiales bacterium]|jgi:hypothetical protein|nr:hypothetical protein [Thermomicrobiales bacterium]MEA2595514.1 hypothetical protein [Thermomicrobiales bacterium]
MRIVIEIDGAEAPVSTPPTGGAGVPGAMPTPPSGGGGDTSMLTPAAASSMAAATGAINAGPAPASLDPTMQATASGAPQPFVGGLPEALGAAPTDANAGAAPGTELEPPPTVISEETEA